MPAMPYRQPRLPAALSYNDLNGEEAVEILTDWFRQLLSAHPQMQRHLTLPMAVFSLDVKVGVDMHIGGTVPIESPPEHIDISGRTQLTNSLSGLNTGMTDLQAASADYKSYSTVVNAAPIPGGSPPDKIREQHSLPVPTPSYGPRETGSHLFISDVNVQTPPIHPSNERTGIVADGYTFASEMPPTGPMVEQHIPVHNGEIVVRDDGNPIHHAGMQTANKTSVSSVKEAGDQRGHQYGSVSGVYDAGPAGLMGKGRGIGGDGRPRISFGNQH